MSENKINNCTEDKYKDKPLKFFDKSDHYELFFVDEFQYPNKDYTVLADILVDLKNADKSKELHIWINSYGGCVINLLSLVQLVKQFDYVVTICSGEAMSCGFDLWCCGNERYVSSFSGLLCHGTSSMTYGKGKEIVKYGDFILKQNELLNQICGTADILTEEELKLSWTTEVWLLGQELIDRGKALPFELYKDRVIPSKEKVIKINDNIFVKKDNYFIKFNKDDSKKYSYVDILNLSKENNH